MSHVVRHQLWILLAAGLVFFTNLGGPALFDEDEPKNAECGREMLVRGDWIVPTFNEELRTDKPILIYWLMLVSYHVFGVTEFAARFWSALLAVGTSLLTYHLGRRLFNSEVGLLAGLMLCTSLMFATVGRAVTPDSVLIFCTTLALTGFVWNVGTDRSAWQGERSARHSVPATWQRSLPMYAAMGLAVLAKGPVGVLMPCMVIGLFLLILLEAESRPPTAQDAPRRRPIRDWLTYLWRLMAPTRFFAACRLMRVPLGALVVAVIALPWYAAVGLKTDGAWLTGFLGGHNVDRFLSPMENHSGPIFYYVPAVLAGFFPWSIVLPAALIQMVRRIRLDNPQRPTYLFLLCWVLVYFCFFSLAGTKLPNYVLPMYPALAVLTAAFLYDWQQQSAGVQARSFRVACRCLGLVGILMLVGLPIASLYVLPGDAWLGIVGAIPLIGAGVAFWLARQEQRPQAVRSLVCTALCLAVALLGFASEPISRHQNSRFFAYAARQSAGEAVRLATYEYFAPSLVFYAERRIERLKQPEQIAEFFAQDEPALMITRADRLEQLRSALPADVQVLARQRRFLRRHDLVLLGRQSQIAARANESRLR